MFLSLRRPRTARWVLASGLSACVLGASPPAQAATPAAGLVWDACPNPDGAAERAGLSVECATLPVPIDWSRPDGPKVNLALARTRAASPAKRIGALLVNPGGPGASGVAYVSDPASFGPALRDSFDIVSWDPRGIAGSQPLSCDTTGFDGRLLFPRTAEQLAAVTEQSRRIGDSCRQRSGPLAEHLDTLSVARDLEAVRLALGEERISFYGKSYGTQIGQHYAELFGDRLRAAALDSNIDHSLDTLGYQRTQAESLETLIGEFAAWCRRTTGCALGQTDAKALVARLLDRADRGQLGTWRTDQVQMALLLGTYSPAGWPELAAQLKRLDGPEPPAPSPDNDIHPDLIPFYYPVTCPDNRWRLTGYDQLVRYEQQTRQAAPTVRYSPLAWSDLTSCHGWPAPVRNPQHQLRPRPGTPPILVAAIRHDPATPYAWSVAVHRQLPGSTLLTYDGAGHVVYRNSPCGRELIERYLLTLDRPKAGTHCPARWPTQGASGARSGSVPAPLPHR